MAETTGGSVTPDGGLDLSLGRGRGRAEAGHRVTIRNRLAWSFAGVILVTGLSVVLALSVVSAAALLQRPPVRSLAPSAVLLHILQPDPLGEQALPLDPGWGELQAYVLREFTASDFDALWAVTVGRRLAAFAGVAGLSVVAIALLSSYTLARRVSKPLTDLASTAQELSAASLDRRLKHPGTDDELGQLTTSINDMLDRLQTSFQDLEDAAAYVSHELRNSLAVVRAQLEVGLSGARDLQTAARQALAATDRASRMIDEAMALATRSIPGDAAPVDIALLVAQVVDDYSRPGTVIDFDLPPEGVPFVQGHPTWLYRAVANLVDNALKHGPPAGPVEIRVSRRYEAVLVEVSDQGPGIPEEEQDLIWRRFGRGNRAAEQRKPSPGAVEAPGRGYGLGLSLVRQAVEAAGGTVWVTSRPGQGSTFSLSLPVKAAAPGS